MDSRGGLVHRTRWAAIGAAIAVSVGAIGVMTIDAAPSGAPASFTPIAPCRLLDTRSGSQNNVGPRSTPLRADETFVATVRGTNGNCAVPAAATSVSTNVTVVNPTSSSFLTVYPADVARPTASNLNWVAGQAPTPNAVTSPLSGDGRLAFYNHAGTVDVVVDIVGYYQPLPVDPFQFDGTAPIATVNATYSILRDNETGVPFANLPRLGWMAPRDCTMSGTIRVLGGATAGQFSLVLTAVTDAGAFRNGSALVYAASTPPGIDRQLGNFVVTKGERVVLSEIANVGIALTEPTVAYFSLTCS